MKVLIQWFDDDELRKQWEKASNCILAWQAVSRRWKVYPVTKKGKDNE